MFPGKPKIMVAFPFSTDARFGDSLGPACAEGLEQLGFSVVRAGTLFHTDKRLGFRTLGSAARLMGMSKQSMPWSERSRLHRSLCELIAKEQPDYLLTISTIALDQKTIDFAHTHGLKKSIGWCVEGPSWIEERPDDPGKHDHYFTLFKDPRFIHLDTLGFSQSFFHPIADCKKDIDIIFVGRYEDRRKYYLSAINHPGLHLYGPRWDTHAPEFADRLQGEGVWGDALNALYNRAKIIINIPSWAPSYADTPNLRMVDVPASGGFLMTEDSPGTRLFFKPGEHIEVFSSPEELADKTRFYLNNDAAREKIARAGYEHVQRMPTYRSKMAFLLEQCGIPIPTPAAS